MTRIVIFANGDLNEPELLKKRFLPGDRIFCANGGTLHALALGLIPEVVVGDMDSLAPEIVTQLETSGVTIDRYPAHKDKTDLELTLAWAIAAQPDEIMLVTALGGRLDQMLANILLLTRPEYAASQLTLADGRQWAAILRGPLQFTVTGQPGDTLSLVPLAEGVQGVSISGVKWPLEQVSLSLGSTLTISNVLQASSAKVTVAEGLLLLIHIAGKLKTPILEGGTNDVQNYQYRSTP